MTSWRQAKTKGKAPYGDSAYGGTAQLKIIAAKKMAAKVGEQGYKNRPLTDLQKASNGEKSRTRARLEHVFDFME
jgi:hypothetical protein